MGMAEKISRVKSDIEKLKNFKTLSEPDRQSLIEGLRTLKILTPESGNAKVLKGSGKGFYSFILHLAPYSLSGFNVCPYASPACIAACLNTSGRGRYEFTQLSRIRKTLYLMVLPTFFLSHLWRELKAAEKKAARLGLKAAIRLNGTSDISWELKTVDGLNPFQSFPNIQFYDYTKGIHRLSLIKAVNLPNYHLTFSKSELNWNDCLKALNLGFNVAVVFDNIPEEYQGFKVVNGDLDDLRFNDRVGVIVGLKAKGKAKKDNSGFVIRACGNTLKAA